MGLVVVTPPEKEPVSVDEVKAQLRVDYADEDGLIEAYVRAARETFERLLWRAFVTQTLALTLDVWPDGGALRLPRPPLQAVNSVTYTDAAGAVHTLDAATYVVDTTSTPGRVVLRAGQAWPSAALAPAAGVRVEYVAGYGEPKDVPEAARQAIRLLAAHWFEHREAVSEAKSLEDIPMGVWYLVAPLRAARF